MKPDPTNSAKRLFFEDEWPDLPKVVAQCLSCNWESRSVNAPEAKLEDNRIQDLDDFTRGWLRGAFMNHECENNG